MSLSVRPTSLKVPHESGAEVISELPPPLPTIIPKAVLTAYLAGHSLPLPLFISRRVGPGFEGEFMRVKGPVGATREAAEQLAAARALAVVDGRPVPDGSVFTLLGHSEDELLESGLADGVGTYPSRELREQVALDLKQHCMWLDSRLKTLRRLAAACSAVEPVDSNPVFEALKEARQVPRIARPAAAAAHQHPMQVLPDVGAGEYGTVKRAKKSHPELSTLPPVDRLRGFLASKGLHCVPDSIVYNVVTVCQDPQTKTKDVKFACTVKLPPQCPISEIVGPQQQSKAKARSAAAELAIETLSEIL